MHSSFQCNKSCIGNQSIACKRGTCITLTDIYIWQMPCTCARSEPNISNQVSLLARVHAVPEVLLIYYHKAKILNRVHVYAINVHIKVSKKRTAHYNIIQGCYYSVICQNSPHHVPMAWYASLPQLMGGIGRWRLVLHMLPHSLRKKEV